jgi:hypothetical protein
MSCFAARAVKKTIRKAMNDTAATVALLSASSCLVTRDGFMSITLRSTRKMVISDSALTMSWAGWA